MQHIKRIANILTDSVSRLRAVGLYHELDFKDHQQELSAPFESLSPLQQSTHTPIEVNGIFIAPDIENLTQNYDTLKALLVTQADEARLSLDNASHADIPHLEHKLMSLPELTSEKVVQLQK